MHEPSRLSLSAPGHPCELEADRVAELATGIPAPRRSARGLPGTMRLTADLEARVLRFRQLGGRPLPEGWIARFEPFFGRWVRDVRLHLGPEAAALAAALKARAFTFGRRLFFTGAALATSDARLLAHELAHVRQVLGGTVPPSLLQRSIEVLEPDGEHTPGKKNRDLVKTMFNRACSGGQWQIDNRGQVTSGAEGFCGRTHGNRACNCFCTLAASSKTRVRLKIANPDGMVTLPGGLAALDLFQFGGVTRGPVVENGVRIFYIGLLGIPTYAHMVHGTRERELTAAEKAKHGVGLGLPYGRWDPWRSLVHEMCSHVPDYDEQQKRGAALEHAQRPKIFKTRSAIEVENEVALYLMQEGQLFTGERLGQRLGYFKSFHPNSKRRTTLYGSLVFVQPNIGEVFRRTGLGMRSVHYYSKSKKRVMPVFAGHDYGENALAPGNWLLLPDVFWHTVQPHQTLLAVADIWKDKPGWVERTPVAIARSIVRANPYAPLALKGGAKKLKIPKAASVTEHEVKDLPATTVEQLVGQHALGYGSARLSAFLSLNPNLVVGPGRRIMIPAK